MLNSTWANVPRYVIRGKPDDPEYSKSAVGVCVTEVPKYIYLYEDLDQAKERFNNLCKAWKSTDFAEHFEIHQVTVEELFSTYKKAAII